MAVRELDGVDDEIQCATGGLSGLTYGTLAVLAKRMSTGTVDTIITPHTAAGTGAGLRTEWTEFNDITLRDSAGALSTVGGHGTVVWRLLVWRKATGSATPRLSIYDYGTATWTHANGNAAIADGTAPSTTGTIRFGIGQFGGRGHYRIAAAAYWSNNVKWATDATGDLAIELAGLHTAYQKWIDATPSASWKFNQASTGTAVADSTGGGADQSAITGTTVVTGDDPTGFSFGGAATVTGATALSAVGTLTAAARATSRSAAVLSASGTLAASGKAKAFGAAALTAAGAMSAATGSTKGAVSMSASGTMTTSAQVQSFAVATLAAAATLGAAATPRVLGSAALAGAGTLAVTAAGRAFGAVVLSALGTLTAAGRAAPAVPPHPEVLTLTAVQNVLTLTAIE